MKISDCDNDITESFNIEEVQAKISQWGKSKAFIIKIYIFGSRLFGYSKKTGEPVRPDSDLDIAVEFDSIRGDENLLTTWVNEAEGWNKELSEILGLRGEIKLGLDWHHETETPHIHQYLEEGSKLIYERISQ